MASIENTFINALLADATYALGAPTQVRLPNATGEVLTGYLEARMTPTLGFTHGDAA